MSDFRTIITNDNLYTITDVNTNTYSANAFEHVFVSTTGGPWSLTPPATPAQGTKFKVTDASGSCGTNNLTIVSGGTKIDGVAADFVVDIDKASVEFTYDTTNGWVITGGDYSGFIPAGTPIDTLIAKSYLTAVANGQVELSNGDHIKFNSIESSSGTNITLDTTTTYTSSLNTDSVGRFVLASGHAYRIGFKIHATSFSSAVGDVVFYIRNSDTGTEINSSLLQIYPYTLTDNKYSGGNIDTIVVGDGSRYEIVIYSQSALTSFAYTNITIQEL